MSKNTRSPVVFASIHSYGAWSPHRSCCCVCRPSLRHLRGLRHKHAQRAAQTKRQTRVNMPVTAGSHPDKCVYELNPHPDKCTYELNTGGAHLPYSSRAHSMTLERSADLPAPAPASTNSAPQHPGVATLRIILMQVGRCSLILAR